MNTLKRTSIILSSIFVVLFLVSSPTSAQDDEQVFTTVEQMPKLNGDMDSLHNEIKYPPEAYEQEVEGRVILQFVVNKNGKAQNIKALRGIGSGLDKEAKRLIKEANFTPGKQRGEPVNVQMSLPIRFKLSEHEPPKQKEDSPSPPKEEEKDDFFVAVEDMPQLKGGLGYLQKKFEYPEMARNAGIEGRVLVQFIVNKQGKVENPKVIRGIRGGCDKEALRVVKEEAELSRAAKEVILLEYSTACHLPFNYKVATTIKKLF